MNKRLSAIAVAVLLAVGLGLAADKEKGEKHWKGIITDSMCAAKGDKIKDADCAKKCIEMGAKWVLYNEASKKAYTLEPQDKAAAHAGHEVVVEGTLSGDTINVESIRMLGAKKSEKPKGKTE